MFDPIFHLTDRSKFRIVFRMAKTKTQTADLETWEKLLGEFESLEIDEPGLIPQSQTRSK